MRCVPAGDGAGRDGEADGVGRQVVDDEGGLCRSVRGLGEGDGCAVESFRWSRSLWYLQVNRSPDSVAAAARSIARVALHRPIISKTGTCICT